MHSGLLSEDVHSVLLSEDVHKLLQIEDIRIERTMLSVCMKIFSTDTITSIID